MPADRLPLAIRVRCEDQFVVVLQRICNRLDVFLAVAGDFPQHVKIIVRVNRAILCRQVAHVAVRRKHCVIITQIFVDRFGLGRGFDDNNWHIIQHLG